MLELHKILLEFYLLMKCQNAKQKYSVYSNRKNNGKLFFSGACPAFCANRLMVF